MTGPTVRLSPARLRTLQLVAAGHTDAEIAAQLGVAPATTRAHVRGLRWAIGARNRAHAVALGYELGLLGGAR